MARGERTRTDASTDVTVLAAGCKAKAELTLDGELRIEGQLQGTVAGQARVVVVGRFDGRIEAHTVTVSGDLQGEVVCERLEIAAGGQVRGEVSCGELVIAEGGRFMGRRHARAAPDLQSA